jgi:hypothetical protein
LTARKALYFHRCLLPISLPGFHVLFPWMPALLALFFEDLPRSQEGLSELLNGKEVKGVIRIVLIFSFFAAGCL